jgi:glutathione S-transferase
MLGCMKNDSRTKIPTLTLCELPDPGIPGIESFSPFCMKAHRALAVAGFPYQRRFGSHPGAFKALNPRGQVPVLISGEEAVADSTEVLRHLIRLGAPLEPAQASLRAEAWLYEELGDTALNGFLVAARWADDETWDAVRSAYFGGMPSVVRWVLPGRLRSGVLGMLKNRDVLRGGLAAAKQRFETLLDQLDARAPARGYWCGDSITVADLGLFPQLQGLRTELTPGWAARVEARVRLRGWLDRVQAATRIDRPRALSTSPNDRASVAA